MNEEETQLAVTGMTCGSCARHVGDALRAVPGVVRVEVDPRGGVARVRHRAGTTPVASLIAAVVHLGYGARPRTDA